LYTKYQIYLILCKQIHNPQVHYDINDVLKYYYLILICESLMKMVPDGHQITTSLASYGSVKRYRV